MSVHVPLVLESRMVTGDGGIENLHVVKHGPQVVFLGRAKLQMETPETTVACHSGLTHAITYSMR